MVVLKLVGIQKQLPIIFVTALILIEILKDRNLTQHECLTFNTVLHIKTEPKVI